ncbi:MAG: glycine zipper family protein [Myxococcota bacterium]|jgi:hypothetical protein|nr:glycine zipper family protein [Myxococcota bacterium]
MKNRSVFWVGACALVALILAGPAWADAASDSVNDRIQKELGVFVYPKGDQDSAKQANDTLACYDSAKTRTDIDPEAPPVEAQAAKKPRGGGLRGAARGAAGGAAIGAIVGDAGDGAAVGAAAGAMRGRRAQKKEASQANQAAEQAAATENTEIQETFKRAFGACMDARNYSVQ